MSNESLLPALRGPLGPVLSAPESEKWWIVLRCSAR